MYCVARIWIDFDAVTKDSGAATKDLDAAMIDSDAATEDWQGETLVAATGAQNVNKNQSF